MNLFAAMQDCPSFWTRALTAVLTASSRSADGITMNGSLPPSSITVGLIYVTGDGGDGLTGRFAAGEGGRRDPRVTQYALDGAETPPTASGNSPRGTRHG